MKDQKQMPDIEVAFQILQEANQPIYFRELISKVLETKAGRVHSPAQAMSEIHTQINLDSRFQHVGKGMWGLNEWTPQREARQAEETTKAVSGVSQRRERLLEEIQEDYDNVPVGREDTE